MCSCSSFLFYLGVSNSHYVFFGDPSHCKPGSVHGLTVGSPSCECVDVEVIPCMTDETGWLYFVFFPPLFLIIFCRMVENERPTTCSTPFHLHLQSISKLNGYRWSPHNLSCIRVVVESPLSKPPHALSHSVVLRKQFVFILTCHAACRAGVVVSGPW